MCVIVRLPTGAGVTSRFSWGRMRPTTSRALAILGGIAIAAVLVMTGYEIWRQRATTIAGAEANLSALSLALAQQTERAFHSVELVVEATALSLENAGGITRADGPEMHRTLRARITGTPQITGVAVIDADGRVVNGARLYPPAPDNRSNREYFRWHRDNAQPGIHISPPEPSSVDGALMIPVSRRLSASDGSFQGVIIASVDPGYFQQSTRRLLPSEGGASAIFRDDGALLTRVPVVDNMRPGHSYGQLAIFQPGAPRHGLGWGPSPLDGAIRILAYHRLDMYPLVVNLSLRRDVLLAEWQGSAVRLALAAGLASLLLAVAVVVLVRQSRRQENVHAALRDSESRLRFAQYALDHAADMVFWVNVEARILYANEAAALRLGYERQGLTGMPIGRIDPHFSTELWPRLLRRLKLRGHVRFETTNLTAEGGAYPAEVTATCVSFAGADYVCAFVRDISQRKLAEAALEEKTAKLEASNAELEQFAYVASHDLREPLRMVSSFVTLLARRYGEQLNDEAREFIALAQDGAVRMDRLILDLLEYSRVGRMERPLAPVDLGRVTEQALRGLSLAAEEAGAEIEVAPDLPMVTANEEEMLRLMLNLVGNAIKYRAPDRAPRIRIGWRREGAEMVCWIADNGIGIAAQDYDRVFRIFQRLHGRGRYEGTGIGLAICKKIVERAGGRIWIDSTPGEGSTFLFSLRAG